MAHMPAGLLPRRPLGRTGLEVSVVGFGASPLGGIFREVKEEVCIAAVHRAFELGINFFDTSPHYGETKSETVLGKALAGLPRERIVVSSKAGRYGPTSFDFSRSRVQASVRESLGRLRLEYLDIVHCHDVEFTSLDQIVNETIPALLELKAQGLVRHIGFSGLPLKVFPAILDRVPEGSVDVVLSYCHYSLNDSTLTAITPYLQRKGVGIINASVLSMGLLTPHEPVAWHPAPPGIRAACREASDHATSKGGQLPALAIRYSLGNPDVASHLIGFSTPEEVEANVATALAAFEPPPPAESALLQEVLAILAPVQGQGWPSGLPENN